MVYSLFNFISGVCYFSLISLFFPPCVEVCLSVVLSALYNFFFNAA